MHYHYFFNEVIKEGLGHLLPSEKTQVERKKKHFVEEHSTLLYLLLNKIIAPEHAETKWPFMLFDVSNYEER